MLLCAACELRVCPANVALVHVTVDADPDDPLVLDPSEPVEVYLPSVKPGDEKVKTWKTARDGSRASATTAIRGYLGAIGRELARIPHDGDFDGTGAVLYDLSDPALLERQSVRTYPVPEK